MSLEFCNAPISSDRNAPISPIMRSSCEFSTRPFAVRGRYEQIRRSNNGQADAGGLCELSRFLGLQEPEYMVYNIYGCYHACSVEVGIVRFSIVTAAV